MVTNKKDILYLASQSPARQKLLQLAGIPFNLLSHRSDEQLSGPFNTLSQEVLAIAQHKIRSLELPDRAHVTTEFLFVITADTLIKTLHDNRVLGKPIDREQAVVMLTSLCKGPAEVVTGCCLEKLAYKNGSWIPEASEYWTSGAIVEFYVDHDSIDTYLSRLPGALQCAGAGIIEDHGLSYLKSINGSFTGVIGLPLYELRQALKKLNFSF